MEDSSQGGSSRRSRPSPRPESSSSNNTRMTPTNSSANSSAAHLPTRSTNGRGAPSGASLLQERLRERKVESARANRTSVDMSGERGGVQSSPIKASSKEERRPSSSGVPPPKGMGVKQMEDQVSTLHKQNFDLKLELYHRRQRQEGLEARLEAAEKQIAEQAEMQEVNEQLLAELERRDQALDEAVGVIVTLEEKVERLMKEREMVRSVDAQFESPYVHAQDLSSSPPEVKPERPSKGVIRMPSFLSEQSEGTEALRSLYLPHNHSNSDATLPKLLEEGSMDGMNSPRLSVLSESSFISVYGEKRLDLNAEPEEPKRHRASSSVEKWVDERPLPLPAATPQRISPELLRKKQFLSINDVLESPLQRLEKLKHTLEKHNLPERLNSTKEKPKSREVVRRVFTDKASFEQQQALPPTPDTISTSTLRNYKNSNDTLAPDATFLNTTAAFIPGITYNVYQSTLSMRPRSAGETVTSRREGHGWDTETQEDLTETASMASTSSTYSAPYSRQKRVITPELFTFGADERERGWGRDMMFNEPRLPTHKRYDTIRRLSMVEHPRSDDTVVPTYNNGGTRYGDLKHGTTPIDTSPRPELPDRRSSLSAVSKLRKSNVPHPSPTAPAVAPGSSPATPISKKSRLTSRLFGRGDPAPAAPIVPQQQQQQQAPQAPAHAVQRPKNNTVRSNSYFESANTNQQEQERATPPPIRRSRTTAYRPSSAGTGMARERERKQSTFGFDGVRDEGDVVVVGRNGRARTGSVDLGVAGEEVDDSKGQNGAGGRKWFAGLRRN